MARLTAIGYDLQARNVIEDPDQETLHRFTAEMPNACRSEFGNLNVQTRVDARSSASTYIVTDNPEETSSQSISRADGREWARIQDEYIRDREMLVISGYIGSDPEFRVPA